MSRVPFRSPTTGKGMQVHQNRVLIKYPEYREKLENRELEFLHFKNLDIKVKDPDFEIKKIEEENCIVELREESYRMCENELRRIVRRIKVSKGRVISVDIDEIKILLFLQMKLKS